MRKPLRLNGFQVRTAHSASHVAKPALADGERTFFNRNEDSRESQSDSDRIFLHSLVLRGLDPNLNMTVVVNKTLSTRVEGDDDTVFPVDEALYKKMPLGSCSPASPVSRQSRVASMLTPCCLTV